MAEWEIGVSGDVSTDPFKGPRTRSPADAAAAAGPRAWNSASGGEPAGLHPFDFPMLRNSVPYNGRQRVYALPLVRGVSPARSMRKYGTQNTVIPTALATGNCDLRTDCTPARSSPTLAAGRPAWPISMTTRPAAKADRRHCDRLVRRGGIGAAAAAISAAAGCIRRAWATATIGSATICKAIRIRARWGCFDTRPTTTSAPARDRALRLTITAMPDLVGGAMLANEFIRAAHPVRGARCRRDAAVGHRT